MGHFHKYNKMLTEEIHNRLFSYIFEYANQDTCGTSHKSKNTASCDLLDKERALLTVVKHQASDRNLSKTAVVGY